jgi:BASS family bile acid:Na+ symporter
MRRLGKQIEMKRIAMLILFCVALGTQATAKIYHKLMKQVELGMDSSDVVRIVGEPTRVDGVKRFFYNDDQVVLMGDEVVDIRLHNRDTRIHLKRQKDGKIETDQRAVSHLRIGMKESEVLSMGGTPSRTEVGTDLYFSNRHRVELNQGKVFQVDMHLKKTLDILDWIRLNFSKGGLLFMNITLAFIMFGVALEIKIEHFKQVLKAPKSAIIGFLSQFVALPALTFVLIAIIKPSPSIAMGMILVAACPGGNISNFISSLAKANVALSVSLTAISTLTAIFLTPLNFALWGSLYSETANLVIPIEIDAWEMIKTVFILLGIPVVLGIWFAHKFSKLAQRIIKPIKIFSIVIFTGFIIAALASNFKFFLSYIHLILLIVFLHNLLALTTGFTLGSLFKLPKADIRTITIETGIQNSGLGLVLIFNPALFNGLGGMAFVAAWWGIWHIIAGLTIAVFWAKRPLN